mgnify:CR=1 FL=1
MFNYINSSGTIDSSNSGEQFPEEIFSRKMRKNILRENGWNVDESIGYLHKTYRRTYSTAASGKKRGRKHSVNGAKYGRPKKKLTGNSYYAAMGKKGGRPRIYNGV